MRAVVQRVSSAAVRWQDASGPQERVIGAGLLVLLGAGARDGPADSDRLADKIAQLRIFPDAWGKTNLSLVDIGGEALIVSQFTLYGDIRRGRRPSFAGSGDPATAEHLCDSFTARLRTSGITTRTGCFGAHMDVTLVNDGPFTMALSTDDWPTEIGRSREQLQGTPSNR